MTDVFVPELKVDGTVEEALAQIDDKGYAVQWSAGGRRVTKCGAVISSEKRNLTRWLLTVNRISIEGRFESFDNFRSL